MFLRSAKVLLLSAAALAAWAGAFGMLKNNDFTKANRSFGKTYRAEKKKPGDEKSRLNDEKYGQKTFKPEDNAEYIREKKYGGTDSELAETYSKAEYRRKDEKAPVPERKVLREEWTRDNTLNWENKDRTLNRDYQGRSDFSKRHPRDAEMRDFYENVQERSMQDINKYMFRSSHSSDPGIPIATAGAQLRGEDATETSFLEDLVFGRRQASRVPVSFKKNMDIGTVAPPSRGGAAQQQAQQQAGGGTKVMPPMVIGDKQKTNAPQERKTKVYERMTDKVLMDNEEKNVRRGKTIIRVEVGDPK